jgi:hypothetical protein
LIPVGIIRTEKKFEWDTQVPGLLINSPVWMIRHHRYDLRVQNARTRIQHQPLEPRPAASLSPRSKHQDLFQVAPPSV